MKFEVLNLSHWTISGWWSDAAVLHNSCYFGIAFVCGTCIRKCNILSSGKGKGLHLYLCTLAFLATNAVEISYVRIRWRRCSRVNSKIILCVSISWYLWNKSATLKLIQGKDLPWNIVLMKCFSVSAHYIYLKLLMNASLNCIIDYWRDEDR